MRSPRNAIICNSFADAYMYGKHMDTNYGYIRFHNILR